ncbi:hypothetical protein EGR_07579 [Echinococcus granulosus]|uniref:Uncharacterized protein n=1 Tax=Echinococcus granulosus TaxID=6210 RepID=W6U8J1_ECHGR|nr:hypothetical protein EGR_07579 [Echinococcus granulosus]EUB57568.1 hypothetical protein EGR_07579 [Echinococcus granulosus]
MSISGERRSSFTNSTRSFFCPLTNQMESTKPSTKVDRMVSPIPSPLPSQPSVSVYGTMDRSSRTRNRSGTFNPSQNDYDNGGFSTWRSSQFYPGVTAGNTGVQSERVTDLGASRISLWSQKTSVEQPEPQRFGSLGRHDDRLIRKYLQRHSSMGSRAFLPETGGGHSFLQYSQR